MQVKQFTGATIDEVLPHIREELGEDALILQTKRVVRGGLGGFFGRGGIEVTAAEGPSRQELAAVNQDAADEAAATAVAEPEAAEEPAPATPFARTLSARLQAAQEAERDGPDDAAGAGTYAPPRGAPAAPFAPGGDERTMAIIAAAQQAVRAASARAADPVEAARQAVQAHAAAAGRTAASVPAPSAGPRAAARPPAPAPAPAREAGEAPAPASVHPALRAARAALLAGGVHRRYADPMLAAVARDALPFAGGDADPVALVREWMADRLPVVRDWKARGTGQMVALVGQTGVGKTTTALKLAVRHRDAGMRVLMVAAGPDPHDVLRAMAARHGLEVADAPDGAALAALRAASDHDLVVVDTAGRSHQRLEEMEELRDLLAAAKPDEVHLVLPVAVPLEDVGDIARRFRVAGVTRLSMTKLDETSHHGNLVNVPLRLGRPLAYVADGPAVPGALAPASARRIADTVLPPS